MKSIFKNISLVITGSLISVLVLTILPIKHCNNCGELYNSLTYKGTTNNQCAICFGWNEYETRNSK